MTTTITIQLQIFADHMGDEWNDIDAAGEAFAEFLQVRLEREFSEFDHDIDVTYHANLSGKANDYVDSGDSARVQLLTDQVSTVADRAWQDFCDSDAAATL